MYENKEIFEILQQRYTVHVSPSKQPYFSIIKDVTNKYELLFDVNINSRVIKESLEILDNYYKVEN